MSLSMDLFDQHRQQLTETEAPLAARMRPRTLDEFIGQEHILDAGRLLRRAIQADRLSSAIFYGPPGTGKTTLARIIANTTHAHFIAINAVLAGVKEIRIAIETAQEKRGFHSQRTILFVDEVHRFNKAQQDALLPWVENGTIVLIGATTENPYFEVNKALVSRSRLFQLQPLNEGNLRGVVAQTLTDKNRGYGKLTVKLDEDALDHLVNVANGDARSLLNALELAVETTIPDASGAICVTLAVAEESIQQRAVLYDKEGDAHFDTISAFIKSMRGSDPDAALYWLARMVYAGEDPRFIFRRMSILASEDVGLADPNAVVVVNACAETFDRIGLPEGRYPLAQAALYLATAPKSNSIMGFFDALAAVEKERQSDIPNHLKDASRDKKGFGHGEGYLYPHAYRDHWVEQQYLPSSLQGQVFYQPSEQGAEASVRVRVARQREAQLAALAEGVRATIPEILTCGPVDAASERWLQRASGKAGEQLASVRDRLFELAQLQRHHVVLNLNAGSGLLIWEAARQVPEGGVYACAYQSADADMLREQALALAELLRPMAIAATLSELPAKLAATAPDLRFDCILGHNALIRSPDKTASLRSLANLLLPGGAIVLYETIPRYTQRIYCLIECLIETELLKAGLSPDLYQRWAMAEEAVYKQDSDPMLNWDASDLAAAFAAVGMSAELQTQQVTSQMHIAPTLMERWFAPSSPSYASYLSHYLSAAEVTTIKELLTRHFLHKTVAWESKGVFVRGRYLTDRSP